MLMTTTDELRQALGKVGIWMPQPHLIGLDPAAYAREIEAAGFTSVWFPGVNAPEDLEAIEVLLAATSRLIAGTGIASVWTWEPAALAARAGDLAARYPGRFVLGLGVSHAPLVEHSGQAYVKPYSKMVRFLDELPPTAAPLVLAALGPKMLQLSAERTAGAHPYFVPPEHTALARKVLGDGPLLIPELAVALADGAAGEEASRGYAKFYLSLPNYTSNLRRLGYGDEDLAGTGSERLLSAVVPHGPEAVAVALRAHLDAGADHVVIQLLAESGFDSGGLAALADIAAVAAG
jgi:probable F420-dependent oxidoreductase